MNAKQATMINSQNSKSKRSTISTEQISFICPRSTEEVYSTGIKLQYLVGDLYLKYENTCDKGSRNTLKALALKQLDKKAEIQRLANIDLNEKLNYFYNNGGPIIEPPVSEKDAKEMKGFFNRIADNYLSQIEDMISNANEKNGSIDQLETNVNKLMVRMLTDLANLYRVNEMRMAFKEMISL